jgi:signal peptidase
LTASQPRRRLRRAAGETLLSVLALGGLVCIVLFVAAMLFNVSVIMFKTGSMSPTITAGSAALVREIPASEIQVGDVVTVSRADALPVTHRVTSVAPSESGSADARIITMRGDANAQDDPAPYDVETVDLVMFSVPGLAHVIVWFSNPFVLGGITIAAALLVTWAFWPRDERGDGVEDEDEDEDEESDDEGDEPAEAVESSERPAGRGRHVALSAIAVLSLAGVAAVGAQPATAFAETAGETAQTIEGDIITLTAIGDAGEMASMRPGAPIYWQVGVEATAPDPGDIDVTVAAEGDSELQLQLGFTACSEQWVDGACAGAETPIDFAAPSLLDAGEQPLLSMPADEQRWLLVTATIPEGASGSVSVTIRANGFGDSVAVTPGTPITVLPATGANLGWMLWLGLGLLAAGVVVARIATHRRARSAAVAGAAAAGNPGARNRYLRGAAVIAALGVLAGLLMPTPRETTAAWTDTELATGSLQAGSVPNLSSLTCTTYPLLLRTGARFSWAAPTGGLPSGASYQVVATNLADGAVSRLDVEGTATQFSFQQGLIGSGLLLGLLTGNDNFSVTVVVVTKNAAGDVVWESAQPPGSLGLHLGGSLLSGSYSCN